jgi:hypothetical protein
MMGVFLETVRNEPISPQQHGQGVPMLVFLVLTGLYFKKRWALMGKAKNPPP